MIVTFTMLTADNNCFCFEHFGCPVHLTGIFSLVTLQQKVAELELQFSGLEKENAEVRKNLKDCHVLLVAANIDPGSYLQTFFTCFLLQTFSFFLLKMNLLSLSFTVLGERVGEDAQQKNDKRKEVTVCRFYFNLT